MKGGVGVKQGYINRKICVVTVSAVYLDKLGNKQEVTLSYPDSGAESGFDRRARRALRRAGYDIPDGVILTYAKHVEDRYMSFATFYEHSTLED